MDIGDDFDDLLGELTEEELLALDDEIDPNVRFIYLSCYIIVLFNIQFTTRDIISFQIDLTCVQYIIVVNALFIHAHA